VSRSVLDVESVLSELQTRGAWNGSFNGTESTLQQLSPYIGKLKTGMVRSLIEAFSAPGDWICDPFSGSGVVLLEALLLGRRAAANDLNIYAYCLTRGKAEAPRLYERASRHAEAVVSHVSKAWRDIDLRRVPNWVRQFFHPRTLKEALAAFEHCLRRREWFLSACLCGILHHQRPGFLSYPSSHLVPYLRSQLFPRSKFPELYGYRRLADRLLAKIRRAYRRVPAGPWWSENDYDVRMCDSRKLPFSDCSMDLVLTSPPYFGALDYARDNRLRLWFLGEKDWQALDHRLTARVGVYAEHMADCLRQIHRVLKPRKYGILIVGDVQGEGRTHDTGALLGALAERVTEGGLRLECVVEDRIPDVRRARRGTKATHIEKILAFRKGH